MFKFFRQHNNWLLVIIGSLTMVGFLITGATQNWFKDDPADTVIAKLADGKPLRTSDRFAAKSELAILGPLTQDPLLLGDADGQDADVRWMLIRNEAEKNGLGASAGEVSTALHQAGFGRKDADGKSAGGLDETAIANYCEQAGTNEAGLRLALAHYLSAEALRQLVSGVGHDLASDGAHLGSPGLQRMAMLPIRQKAMEYLRQAAFLRKLAGNNPEFLSQAWQLEANADRMMQFQAGSQRMSEPLLSHQLQNLNAGASGSLVIIPAGTPTRLAMAAEPSEADLKALFEPLKDSPRGSAPNGFGYRLPARVQMEALGIPIDQVRKLTDDTATEEQVREWFDAHTADFAEKTADGPAKPAVLDAANREKARSQLRADLAKNKALEIARFAESAMGGDHRLAESNNGQLPPDAKPTPLAATAEAIRKKFHVEPVLLSPVRIQSEALAALSKDPKQVPLYTAGAPEGWMTPQELLAHPVFGQAALVSQSGVTLPVMADHLANNIQTPLPGSLKLAVNLSVPAVCDSLNSCWITRFVAASPSRPASTLDEVKVQVIRDCRELAAYNTLSGHTKELMSNAAAKNGVEKFAGESDRYYAVPNLTRADFSNQAGSPRIPGVGQSESLVKAVFERAEQLREKSGGVAGASLADRLVAVPVDGLCAVVLFELRDYAPIAKSRCRELAANPMSRFAAHATAMGSVKDPQDPFKLENLQKRLGWTVK